MNHPFEWVDILRLWIINGATSTTNPFGDQKKKTTMKNTQTSPQPPAMSTEMQNRLLAYSTAASLGAFFAGQSAEAAVVQSPGLAPYPHVFLPPGLGETNANNFFLSIEGGSITNFQLFITGDITSHLTNKTPAQVIRMPGIVPDTNNPAVVNGQVLSMLRGTATAAHGYTNSYCVAFLGGLAIGNNTNSPAPWYQPQLGISYNYGSAFPWKNYVNSSFQNGFPNNILGFRFTSSVDGQEHFGYMDVKTTFVSMTFEHLDPSGNPTTSTKKVLKSVVVNDCYYETTPMADITVPKLIKITSIVNQTAVDGTIIINFGPNSVDDPAESFEVQTSPTLGPSAVWTTDQQAFVYQVTPQKLTSNPIKPATYQAITYPAAGASSQYWRIKKL